MLISMTDEKLFFLCKKYGEIVIRYRNKFAGLLPEVYRRQLYEKKGFGSIFEFAAKLAGMSEEQVRRVLNLERRFEIMPVLREMLVKGEVSISKLAKVASIATPENQEDLARQVKLLPRSALEVLVRDEKADQETKSVPGNTHLPQNPENTIVCICGGLTSEVRQKLLELQTRGININTLFMEFLEKRTVEIAQEKEALAAECSSVSSRHIPEAVNRILKKEYGVKCSIERCTKPANVVHHTQRFALSKNHNPKFLAPLCKDHHIIAHSIDLQFHNCRSP